MEKTYMNQFTVNEQHPLHVPEFLLQDPSWLDHSYGNDAMPHWFNTKLGLSVFVDFDNRDDREFSDWATEKYHVYVETSEGMAEMPCFETDAEVELLAYLLHAELQVTLKELGATVSTLIGKVEQLPNFTRSREKDLSSLVFIHKVISSCLSE